MLQYAEFFNRLDAYGLQMTEHRLVVGPAWHGTREYRKLANAIQRLPPCSNVGCRKPSRKAARLVNERVTRVAHADEETLICVSYADMLAVFNGATMTAHGLNGASGSGPAVKDRTIMYVARE